MVGQHKLIEKINSLSINTIPKSLLLVGERGCGKHIIATLISNKLELPVEDISDSLNLEIINKIYLSVNPTIYIINSNSISPKEESVLLKILEEPTNNAFFIILCEDKNSLLNTIQNRCQCWEFEKYSKEELKEFSRSDIVLEISRTPGQAKKYSEQPIEEMIEFGNKIFEKLPVANFANVLSIPNKINFKDENDKYDYDTFVEVLDYCALNKFKNGEISDAVFKLTHGLLNDSKIKNINKRHLFENYLYNLKYFKIIFSS